MSKKDIRACAAEALGTFGFVFLGAGAVCADFVSGESLGLTGTALAHGLAFAVLYSLFAPLSACHFNPAVTFAAALSRRVKPDKALLLFLCQMAGAAAAGWTLLCLHSDMADRLPYLGAVDLRRCKVPGGIALEALLTSLWVATALCAERGRFPEAWRGWAIGAAAASGMLMGGYFTGAAMNPARAFGPALFSGHWDHHLVYWVGPLLGGAAAAAADRCFFGGR